MARRPLRSWLNPFRSRRPSPIRRQPLRSQLTLERFEERTVPSSTIPLSPTTWTPIGPSPIAFGQAFGSPSATGRVNGVAVDPSDPRGVIYVAADSGGIWRSVDGGTTWSPRTDSQQLFMQTIAEVDRGTNDTVYAFDQLGNLFTSTDGATTFTKSSPFPVGAFVNKLAVRAVDVNDQTKDILFAAVGTIFGNAPSTFPDPTPPPVPGSGIWVSTNGGQTWRNIVNPGVSPFTTSQTNIIPSDALSFSDVVVNPANPNIVYAAVGNAFGDPTNGVYRSNNALSATPTWSLLIGGSSFVPGETPGNIKLAIAPSAPSVVFAALTLRVDPQTGFAAPLLGVFRSLDSGANWGPSLLPTNPNAPINDPNNYMGLYGYDNSIIEVAPTGSTNPQQQTVIVGGFGSNPFNTVMISNLSGAVGSWGSGIGIGNNGVGVYPNIHQAGFDNQGRMVVATGGGVYRLNSSSPVSWVSLNGASGPGGLNVTQFNGFALHPTDPNQAIGNSSYFGDLPNAVLGGLPGNVGPALHNAQIFFDQGSAAPAGSAYGWFTIDAPGGFDDNFGAGQVLYNPFDPQTVYRVVPDDGSGNFIRKSTDGGVNWAPATAGFEADPFVSATPTQLVVLLGDTFIIPPLVLDPSQPNRLFSGFLNVQVSDDNGDNWGEDMVFGAAGATNNIPHLPTSLAGVPITSIGVGRVSGVSLGEGFNGVTLFVGTQDTAFYDPTTTDDDPTSPANPNAVPAGSGPQLWVNMIPTNAAFPPGGFTFDEHSWANITPTDPATGDSLFTGNVKQIIVDPANNNTLYVITATGQVFRGSDFQFQYLVDPATGVIWGFAPDLGIDGASATWTDLTGDLPAGGYPILVANPQGLALDSQVLNDPTDDVLYVAAPAGGVWKLVNPEADFSTTPPHWQQVGLGLPGAPVTALSLNTTTGILGAATYGRGAFEIQVRGLVSGHVFTDLNGNGALDTGEQRLSGVTVEVLDNNQLDSFGNATVIAATTTDSNGFYEFRSLVDGNYTIKALGPSGQVLTTGQPPELGMFTQGSNLTVDVGFFQLGSITGTKFNDLNGNGAFNTGEPGLGGFTFYIDSDGSGTFGPGEISTTSAANGTFTFTNLGPASLAGGTNPVIVNTGNKYVIREAPQVGWIQTTADPAGIQVNSGQNATVKPFGNLQKSSISGVAFVDANGDGARQGAETGGGGFTIQLTGPGGTLTTTTAANGSYSFPDLAPGTYTVTQLPLAGWTRTTADPAPITVGATTQVNGINFGDFKNVTISAQTFDDLNGNGTLNAGEPGVGGFTIDLVNSATSAVLFTTTSAASGAWSFTGIGPLAGGGQYRVVQEPRTGYVQTTTNPAGFAPTSGTDVTSFQFGDFKLFAVSGTAYVDLNRDGAQDNGETGAAGFDVKLLDSTSAVVGTATSDASGAYSIPNVGPGTYTVVEGPRSGYGIMQGSAGYPITGQSGTDRTGLDFGNVQVSSISGTVFVDTNGNGSRGAAEVGGSGFTVRLAGPGGTQTFVTGANGSYSFDNLTPGTYTLTQLPLAGWTRTTADPAAFTVTGTDQVTGVQFGDFKNVTLSGQVFNDVNGNGAQDTGETGLTGFAVDLINATTNAVIASTTSTAGGAFSFANVGPLPGGGQYRLRADSKVGFVQTTVAPPAFAPSSGTDVSTFRFGEQKIQTRIVTARGSDGAPTVTVRDAASGQIIRSFDAYDPSFGGGVRVATGLFNGDAVPDIVTAAGPGGGPHVRLFDGATGAVITEFYAYGGGFSGGVYVAVGDVNGDGTPDIITGAGAGGGPHVRVFSGTNGSVITEFYAYGGGFSGGVRVAAADVDGDGHADIITGAGPGGGPHVRVFSGLTGAVIREFYAYDAGFGGGVYVAAGDVTGDGRPDIITGPGEGGGPHLRVFDGVTGGLAKEAFAFGPGWSSGLHVGVTDSNGDGFADIIVSGGPGQPPYLRVFDGRTLADLLPGGIQLAYNPGFLGGVFVSG